MPASSASLDGLLALRDLPELRAGVAAHTRRAALTLPEARSLVDHALALAGGPATATEFRLAVVHTYTSELLDPWLEFAAALQGLRLVTYHAPYGMLVQEAQPDSALVRHAPDAIWFMLQRSDLHPALGAPIAHLGAEQLDALRAQSLARVREIVTPFRVQATGRLVVSLLPAPAGPALGLFDAQAEASERRWWSTLDADIAAWLRTSVPTSTYLDLDELAGEIGRRRFYDLRYWYSSRFPFSGEGAAELARRVVAVGAVVKTPRAKVIVLDADNTLWGGVIGEDGMEGIALGPDYPGNVHVEFQRRLLGFQQRGLLLAMCSKNNAADVDEVLKKHPHQLLRDEHFAAMRVNWVSKADNLVSLAEELNVGLDSFVFVDDSDHECAEVRARLPQVEVVQVPKRAIDIPACLDHVARLEILALTAEDAERTAMYAQERQRKSLLGGAAQAGTDAASHLERLGMRMRIAFAPASHVPRLAQLTQKTNQFNLTTRRYDEQRLRAFIDDRARWLVADFSLADKFGDSGIVGLALVRIEGQRAELDTYLMSCRVIGRCAGEAFLQAVLRELAERGIDEVVADHLPTAKNALVNGFLAGQGFTQGSDGRWHRSLRARPPESASTFPIAIELAPVPATVN
jgi:FkbH-like protein